MSLGANAFAPPMYVAANEEEPSRWRKAMPFLIVAGIALGSALAVWIVMLVNQPPSPEDAEKEQKELAAAAPELEPPAAPEPPAAEAQAEPAAPADPRAIAEEAKPAAEADPPAAEANAAKPAAAEKEAKEDGRSSAERDAARERRHAARATKAAGAAPAANKPAAPSRADIIAAMGKVQPAVVRCMSGTRGIVTADMKILSTGRVASVNVTGAFGPAGSCIANAVRKAQFPEFTTPSIAVKYPMKL